MKVLGYVAASVMAVMIIYGFVAGEGFGTEGGVLLDLAWGRVTIVDLYVALALFGAWVVRREGVARSLPWLLGLVVGGSFTAGVYLIYAAKRSVPSRSDR